MSELIQADWINIINYDCSAHALIFLIRYDLTSALRSTLYFFPLDLLIFLKITCH